MRHLVLLLVLCGLATPAWSQTRVTRTSATEFRVETPVVGSVAATEVVEWRLKLLATWSLQGIYARNVASGIEVQLSDPTNTSVYEYAFPVAEAGAPVGGYDFFGNGHGHETPLSATLELDGVSVLSWSVAQTGTGTTFVLYQTSNARLPLHANGTVDDVTIAGSGTLRHTLNRDGLLVEHTHIMLAGFTGKGDYAAMCPANGNNFNRVQQGTSAPYTPVGTGVQIGTGQVATTFSAWHTSAHPYRMTMTLPSGGPDLTGTWTNAGPERTFMVDNAGNIKFYVMVQGGTLANARNLGSTSHAQRYVIDLFTGSTEVTTNRLVTGGNNR